MYIKTLNEPGDYVDIETLQYCNLFCGDNIYTPLGKVTPENLQGFEIHNSIDSYLNEHNIEVKHQYDFNEISYEDAMDDALMKQYVTFVWNETIYKTN